MAEILEIVGESPDFDMKNQQDNNDNWKIVKWKTEKGQKLHFYTRIKFMYHKSGITANPNMKSDACVKWNSIWDMHTHAHTDTHTYCRYCIWSHVLPLLEHLPTWQHSHFSHILVKIHKVLISVCRELAEITLVTGCVIIRPISPALIAQGYPEF